MKTVALPRPREMNRPLQECMEKRRSGRAFSDREIPADILSAMLWACTGVTDTATGHRATPSTRGRAGVDVYALRADGAWRYDAARNALEQVTAEDIRPLTTELQHEFVDRAPLTLVFVADREKTRDCFPEGVYCDASCMTQNAALVAACFGISGVVRASLDHAKVARALGLPSHLEPVLAYTAGHPA